MSPEFNSMLGTAREYCRVIESIQDNDNWLDHVSALLPRLHAAISTLRATEQFGGTPVAADFDTRFELYSTLFQLLGERDSYWMEFDVAHDGQQMSGSLADDLTDIYCELKSGLSIMDDEEDPVRAMSSWRQGYRLHWGQHLVDAERHLYELSARGQLPD